MFGWPVLLAWGIALLAAIVILAFCGYELRWKAARLRRDQERLAGVAAELAAVGQQLAEAQQRLDAARHTAGR